MRHIRNGCSWGGGARGNSREVVVERVLLERTKGGVGDQGEQQ